jgi:hypothetical protein
MEKIKISITLNSEVDKELYSYFLNIPQRRRATFFRELAEQRLSTNKQQTFIEIKKDKSKIETLDSILVNDEIEKNKEIKVQKILGAAMDDI